MRYWLICLCLYVGASESASPATLAPSDVRRAVVQVFNQNNEVNFQYPWQNGNINASYGSGVIISGNRILTNAHVVDNSLQLQVRKVGSDTKFLASVKFISDERDLALLEVEDKHFFDDTKPMQLGELPQLGDEVTTYGFPVGGSQLGITRGIVSRIDYDVYAHSGYPNLVCQIDAAINPGASGGPAIVNGKLAGLNFQGLQNANNVGYVVPAPVIQSFLKDIGKGNVSGVPEMAIVIQPMENAQLRQRYGLSEKSGGVLVTSLSGLEKERNLVRVDDVLVAIDGQSVGDDGTVRFAGADRIDSNILIAQKQIGEHVSLQIIRDGKPLTIDYPLAYTLKDARIVPGHQSNFVPDYEVIGGLVLVEVNEDLLRSWKFVPPSIELKRFEYRRTGKDVNDRLLLVVSVLPDDINIGYSKARFAVLTKVNGSPVRNLKELREKLQPETKGREKASDYLRLSFAPHDNQVVFSRKELANRMPTIAKRYGVPINQKN